MTRICWGFLPLTRLRELPYGRFLYKRGLLSEAFLHQLNFREVINTIWLIILRRKFTWDNFFTRYTSVPDFLILTLILWRIRAVWPVNGVLLLIFSVVRIKRHRKRRDNIIFNEQVGYSVINGRERVFFFVINAALDVSSGRRKFAWRAFIWELLNLMIKIGGHIHCSKIQCLV